MYNTIHPIIFFSISEKPNKIYDSINNIFGKINTAQFKERYFRYIGVDNQFVITNSFDNTPFTLPINNIVNKSENYKIVNSNIDSYISIFEKTISSIYNLDNINYAVENSLKVGSPQIVILGEIDNPILSPLVISFLQNLDFAKKLELGNGESLSPQVHLLLLYNTKLQTDQSSKESAIYKNAFLKEIESSPLDVNPFVWLLDIINEQSVNLEDEKILNYSIAQFTDLLFTNASDLIASTYNTRNNENGKPCMYSTFGFSNLHFPEEKIKDYLLNYAKAKEFTQLENDLSVKFEIITLKDEATRFFQTNNFNQLPEKISKNEKAENIFIPFKFNASKFIDGEKEKTIDSPLSLIISPDTVAKVSSADFFHQIEEAKKKYSDEVSLNFSQQLDFAKKRETENVKHLIENTQQTLMDTNGKGISYSLLFVAVLANNKAVVESMLEGRFTSDIPTFVNIQENFRSLFIGEDIKVAQKEVRDFSDKVSNNTKLITQYTTEQTNALKTVDSLKTANDESNPKVTELTAKIENYKTQILNLTNENVDLNNKISNHTFFIESRKNEFDQDPTKESFKESRTKKLKEEVKNLNKEIIPQIDSELATLYLEKNNKIENRKKFIFYRLFLIPALSAIFLIISCFLANKYANVDFLKGLEFSIAILLIYFIVVGIKFFVLKKKFEELIDQITQKIQNKMNALSLYADLLNKVHNSDFEFERDLISFNIVTPFIEMSLKYQEELSKFKDEIIINQKEFNKQTEEFIFQSNPFEFCVIEKLEINKIYDSSYLVPIISTKETGVVKLSNCFRDFVTTKKINSIIDPISKFAEDVFQRKIVTEQLKDIIFNQSKIFDKKSKPDVLFQKLYHTSRPLLRTEKLKEDVPYCQDISVGLFDETYTALLKGINFNKSIKIEEKNKNNFGLISIKSNFPSFLIYDTVENESIFNELVNNENRTLYFINENAAEYSLLSNGNSNQIKTEDIKALSNYLIFAIARGDIKFDAEKSNFYNENLGVLGSNWEELIKKWNAKVCLDLSKTTERKYNDMLSIFEENDYISFVNRFKDAFLSVNIIISRDMEEFLSVFFFSILKGSKSDWDIISEHFKAIKRKSI
jgi:hypothetical protein